MVDKRKSPRKFDEEFKKSIVKLYEGGKSQNALANEYGVAKPKAHGQAMTRVVMITDKINIPD
ncbi:transposase [Staphylococcus aureus]|nr:transposase [Enterococcus faecalis]NVE20613.1 transposase [Staphylococcus aureus]